MIQFLRQVPATLVMLIKFFRQNEIGRCYYISIENNIIQMNAANASNTILESDYGIHTLVIYEDLVILREFYSQYVKKGIEERNEVIQLAPFYETEDCVRKTLSEGNIIDRYIKMGKSRKIINNCRFIKEIHR